MDFIAEPVDVWQNTAGHNILKLFYDNPSTNAFLLQSVIHLSKLSQLCSTSLLKPIRLIERSMINSQHVFAKVLAKNGFLKPAEIDVLNAWIDSFQRHNPAAAKVDYIIYLKTTPEVCLDRLNQRSRLAETKISIDYLQEIHSTHEEWIRSILTSGNFLPKVIEVDGLLSIELLYEQVVGVLEKILNEPLALGFSTLHVS